AAAQEQTGQDEKLLTVVYDVKELLHQPGSRGGFDKIEDVIKIVLTSVNPGSWRGSDKGSSLQELNGNRLEIRTTEKQHAAVRELLTALRRLMGASVDLKTELVEMDRAAFDKDVRPALALPGGKGERPAAGVADEVLKKLREG